MLFNAELYTNGRLGHMGAQNKSLDPPNFKNLTWGSCVQTLKKLNSGPIQKKLVWSPVLTYM